MKTLKICITGLIACCSVCFGSTYYIGTSPFIANTDERDAVLKSILLFGLETASLNDKVSIYDAYNLKELATFEIPAGKLFANNPRARAQRIGGELARVKQFFMTNQPCEAKVEGSINLPQFIAMVSTQTHSKNELVRIVVIGSALYMSPNQSEPAFNMDEAYPSDQHILADERQSVWGTANRKSVLSGATIYYAYLKNAFVNELHREMVGRFLALYFKGMGGTLVTFSPDPRFALMNAAIGVEQPFADVEIDSSDSKLVMHRVTARDIAVVSAEKPSPPPVSVEVPVAPVVVNAATQAVVSTQASSVVEVVQTPPAPATVSNVVAVAPRAQESEYGFDPLLHWYWLYYKGMFIRGIYIKHHSAWAWLPWHQDITDRKVIKALEAAEIYTVNGVTNMPIALVKQKLAEWNSQ